MGNLFDVPSPQAFPWETYLRWGRQHGVSGLGLPSFRGREPASLTPFSLADSDIVRVSALGMNIVVANTLEVATELLDKRSAIYSDRSGISPSDRTPYSCTLSQATDGYAQ